MNTNQAEDVGALARANGRARKDKCMLLGFELHSWETAMIVSLIVAALAAAAVGITTWGALKLTRAENAERAVQIAEANKRAEEARLALAQFREPRSIDSRMIVVYKSPRLGNSRGDGSTCSARGL
ncbi:MAG TPA: hypothetical protein VIN75_25035 [Burkholderiaceae bacterium]